MTQVEPHRHVVRAALALGRLGSEGSCQHKQIIIQPLWTLLIGISTKTYVSLIYCLILQMSELHLLMVYVRVVGVELGT